MIENELRQVTRDVDGSRLLYLVGELAADDAVNVTHRH